MARPKAAVRLAVYSIRLPEKMLAGIQALAHKTGLSQQELVRRGIEQFLKDNPVEPSDVRAVRRKGLARKAA